MTDARDIRPNLFPALRYRDSAAALGWLQRAFGFEKGFLAEAADGSVAHAELHLGPGTIMLGTVREGTDNPWDAPGMGLYVAVDDVDALHARAVAAGAEIVRPLADTDYGSREVSVRDVEGHLWSFGSYRPAHPAA